jgi:hypothetical protein
VKTYTLTVFDPSGKKLLDESFQANNDDEAKKAGEKRLKEENYENHSSRVTSPTGQLVHFHR